MGRRLVWGVRTRNGVDTFAVPEWGITFEMPNARRRILRRGAVLTLVLAILGGTVLFLGERGVPPGFVTFAQSTKELDA